MNIDDNFPDFIIKLKEDAVAVRDDGSSFEIPEGAIIARGPSGILTASWHGYRSAEVTSIGPTTLLVSKAAAKTFFQIPSPHKATAADA